jgi:hypothetical protein
MNPLLERSLLERPRAARPLLERMGVSYFRRLSASQGPVDAGDGVHFLNPRERAALREVVKATIKRACAAGALSALVAATTEILAHPLLGPEPDLASWSDTARFWTLTLGATALASVIEIAFLYWDGLRAVHRLAHVAGLDLFPDGPEAEHAAVAAAMARAALELPNPTHELFGIDPLREASRFGIVVASLIYKAKISASSFLLKMFVRRLVGRTLVRAWLPLLGVPVTAAWNGVVAWLVLREARIRAMGPSAAKEMIGVIFARAPALSDEGRVAAKRAVAAAIVRTRDLHPNLVALWIEVRDRVGPDETHGIDDARLFIERLRTLSAEELAIVLRILGVASILDGRVTAAERRLLRASYVAVGRSPDLAPIHRLRRAFLRGDAIAPELIDALG